MGYELNSRAHQLLTQIEVAIREFFIKIIKEKGITNWISNFLGTTQKGTIQDFVKAVNELVRSKEELTIEGIYIYKLNRTKKSDEGRTDQLTLLHPFYYLNWTDMDNLISLKTNTDLIEKYIGKHQRPLLSAALRSVNDLRNDIAHSRYITDSDFEYILGVYNQIAAIIPNFSSLYEEQSIEYSLNYLTSEIKKMLAVLKNIEPLTSEQITNTNSIIEKSIQSFWLSSFAPELVKLMTHLKTKFIEYESLREKPGSLLKLIRWRETNLSNMLEIEKIIDNGKI